MAGSTVFGEFYVDNRGAIAFRCRSHVCSVPAIIGILTKIHEVVSRDAVMAEVSSTISLALDQLIALQQLAHLVMLEAESEDAELAVDVTVH